jgi:pimeloyl-ACP methyl ester carboxylesterase
MSTPYTFLSKANLSAVVLSALVLAHAGTPARAGTAPACSADVRSRIATLCAGSVVGLGSLSSSAEVLLCMPPAKRWNGDLVLFARGTTRFAGNDCKLASTIGQLDLNGTSVPRLANQLGFAFATSSCSKDVLAVQECKADMVELAATFQDRLDALQYGTFSGRIFLTGASMGGLVATQLIERSRNRFAGALAACGPTGDFKKMVRYQGDLLVLVDALYRDELRQIFDSRGLVYPDGDRKPVVPWRVRNALKRDLCPALARIIDADSAKAGKVLRIMAATGEPVATDPTGAHTVGDTIADVVCSDTLPAIPVFEARLGGNPYGNLKRVYVDPQASPSANRALNRRVDRFAADLVDDAEDVVDNAEDAIDDVIPSIPWP